MILVIFSIRLDVIIKKNEFVFTFAYYLLLGLRDLLSLLDLLGLLGLR